MSRLLVANDCAEQAFGQTAEVNQEMAVWALRLLWYIEDNDVIILPIEPYAGYLEYIAELKGVNYESLQVIIAPQGSADYLSADRIRNLKLHSKVTMALSDRNLESVLSLTPDAAVVDLVRSLGSDDIIPGAAFASQRGGTLANSKAVFRAIAAGVNVLIPDGAVIKDAQEAEEIIANMLLVQKVPVIIKKEFGQGCRGNEVLSHVVGVVANGGRRGVVLPDRPAIKNYIFENWEWLTNSGYHCVVIERFFPNSVAIFAEFDLTDDGVKFGALGEMLAAPIANSQVIPPVGLAATTIARIVESGYRLAAAIHTIGYRGILSADAIVTPDTSVLFTEYNGRMTGSTHMYSTIGERIIGKDWMQRRILMERRGWRVPSFQAALDLLNDFGLAFNRETQSGVVLTGPFFKTRKVMGYTVVAENLAAAISLEAQLNQVSSNINEISI
jgi:hypothetical protein